MRWMASKVVHRLAWFARSAGADARAFGNENGDAAGEIFDLLTQIGAPASLKDIGMSEGDLDFSGCL